MSCPVVLGKESSIYVHCFDIKSMTHKYQWLLFPFIGIKIYKYKWKMY